MAGILPELPKVEAAIVEITNTVRAEQHLAALTVSAELTAAAKAYAALLARKGLISHDADGKLSDRTGRAGYQHCMIAENLAMHQDSRGYQSRALAVAAMESWLNSPGHRDNLMKAEITETGVAVARTADPVPKYISVQLFGRPQALSIAFQVSNSSAEAVSLTFGGETSEVAPHMAMTMQSCSAGQLVVHKATGKAVVGKYQATDGMNYVISPGGPAGLKVEAVKRITVK